MALQESITCLYFCESDSFCPPMGVAGNAALFTSWACFCLPGSTQDPWASVGQKPEMLAGSLLHGLAVRKVASLLLHAGARPWNLPLFLGYSALEGFKMPLTAAFLAEYRGPWRALVPVTPSPFLPSLGRSSHFLCELPHPPDLLRAFPSFLTPCRTFAQNPTQGPLGAQCWPLPKWNDEIHHMLSYQLFCYSFI